ncbi:hypothetical protein PROFUN_08968 [Planoprotostelium fungivorum]|uniref:PB1 domain-containing protein n=1 Tax=Planoprotostelium fungivorum TaxID=1890364 RepID=A0A2P6NII6_9EUKA|nr:hypothetical protein PROFUN_10543 [Planoprotostelium fungivorum]PRP83770.1 hypothetical protein PROFUN_08968 [Planoprotostelium fungivorum]
MSDSQATHIDIKAYWGADIRRDRPPRDLPFSALATRISSLFHRTAGEGEELRFRYMDDEGDWIDISTEREWRTAVDQINKILRLVISPQPIQTIVQFADEHEGNHIALDSNPTEIEKTQDDVTSKEEKTETRIGGSSRHRCLTADYCGRMPGAWEERDDHSFIDGGCDGRWRGGLKNLQCKKSHAHYRAFKTPCL